MHFAGLILLAVAAPALGHPGPHGAQSFIHLLTEADHLATLAAPLVVGLVWLLRRLLRRR